MFLQRSLSTAAVFILALSSFAFAQEAQATSPQGGLDPHAMRQRDSRRQKRGRHVELGLMSELNLSDDQKQQQRAIMQKHVESIKAPREELFKLRERRMQGTFNADDEARVKALRQEIHDAMKSIQSEVEGILTAEQRAKFEQLKAERRARYGEMRERRQDRRLEIPR